MDSTTPPKYNAPALDKGLDILEHLSKEGIALSQAEIAQGIDKTPSEIYRMLVCLEERNYIVRSANSGKYRLSLKMYSLSHRHTPFDELKRVAQYPMQALSELTRQSCHLGIIHNGQLMIVSQTRSPGPVSLSIEEGTLFPLSLTNSGKVLLAMMPEGDRADILAQDQSYAKLNKERRNELQESIEEADKLGYLCSNSKITTGVTDISVPIGLSKTQTVAALAVSSLTSSMHEEVNVDEIVEAIKKAQADINRLLGS